MSVPYFRETINCPDLRLTRFSEIIDKSFPDVNLQDVSRDVFGEKLNHHVDTLNRKLSQLKATEQDYYKYDRQLGAWVTYFGKYIFHMECVLDVVNKTLQYMVQVPDEVLAWDNQVAQRYYNSVLQEVHNMERMMGSSQFRAYRN